MELTIRNERKISRMIKGAEAQIKKVTGVHVCLVMVPADDKHSEHEVIGVVAKSLGMCIDDYYERNRQGLYVHLRSIAVLMMDLYCKHMTPREMGELIGVDRTTVIYYRWMSKNLLGTKDEVFTTKYYKALNAINK